MPVMCEKSLRRDGVAVVRGLVDATWLESARMLADRALGWPGKRRAGVRNAIASEPRLGGLLRCDAVKELMSVLCGPGINVIRSIVFDKSPDSNWAVPWHQDATIAVRQRIEAPGFGPWAVKSGEHHCQPPRDILDQIVTLRIHLDDCSESNGPLRVVPGSHRDGLVSDHRVEELAAAGPVNELSVAAGDAVVMYPHVVHSSPRATNAARRRVLHLDCTSAALPCGLQWAEDLPLH